MMEVLSEPGRSDDKPAIEITPAMIEAGVLVLWNSGALDHPSAADRELVRDIYLQMDRAAYVPPPIEITPAMIEAGAKCVVRSGLLEYPVLPGVADEFVYEILQDALNRVSAQPHTHA